MTPDAPYAARWRCCALALVPGALVLAWLLLRWLT